MMDTEQLRAYLATLSDEDAAAFLQQMVSGQPTAQAQPQAPAPQEDPSLQALSGMSDAQIQQQTDLGTVQGRSDIVAQQLAQADALRNADVGNFSTPGGAALGGLGNVIGKLQGGLETNQLRGQQQDLLGQLDAGRAALLAAKLREGKKPTAQGNAAAASDVYGAVGDIFGGFGGF